MREILFRGKRIDNGEWMEGYLIACASKAFIVDASDKTSLRSVTTGREDKYDWRSIRGDPATVGQYIGLVDKHGKKIFEGDYIKVVIKKYGYDGMTETETTQKGLVAYDSIGMIGLVLEVRDGRNLWSDCFLELAMSDSIIDYYFEVIGNIHDNPNY